jgi:hypothetical protein
VNTIKEAAIIAAAGAAILVIFGLPVARALRAKRWPHAAGAVTKSAVHTVDESTSDGSAQRLEVIVNYRYTVAGATYHGTRVSYFPPKWRSTYKTAAERYRDTYAPGATVDVRYNPAAPADAVIDTGMDTSNLIASLVGVLFLLAGISVLVRGVA